MDAVQHLRAAKTSKSLPGARNRLRGKGLGVIPAKGVHIHT